ncbi:MAG: diguanylate cyclase [Bryobacteraceae bacterium]
MNLSLKSLIKELDGNDPKAESALHCYRAALRDLRTNLVVTSPDFKREVQTRLDRLIATVSRTTTNEILESAAFRLAEILTDYRNQEETTFEEEQLQLRKTVLALEALVAAIAKQDQEHSEQLNSVLTGLEDALFEGDLLATHRSLQEQIRKLRSCVVAIAEDTQTREAGFEKQIEALRVKSDGVSHESADRQEQRLDAASALNGYLETCTLFSLILVRIHDMKELAQHWSPSCRNQLLSVIQARVAASLGSLDRLHPWTDGEFLVVMRSTLVRAKERSERIRQLVNGPWDIEVPFGTAKITIRCSVGAVEYTSGEDLAGLLARAESAVAYDAAAHPRNG